MTDSFKPNEIRGAHDAAGHAVWLVVSRFNSFITERLLAGALEALGIRRRFREADGRGARARLVRDSAWRRKRWRVSGAYDAVIAIGCILRGETAHFDYLATEVARGIQLAQMDTGVPVIFCVLTCDTLEQAIDRAGLKGGNKGYEAGLAALEMARVIDAPAAARLQLPQRQRRAQRSPADMPPRHKAREFALQMLFQWEIGKQEPSRIEDGFWRIAKAEKSTRDFANQLFEGVAAGAPALDELIVAHAENWRLERMAVIDRAIMRLAAYELRSTKTPPKVVLNEALELAKTFSSEDAAGFINGVLDAVLHALPKKEKRRFAALKDSGPES